MKDIKELKDLAITVVSGKGTANFSHQDASKALTEELRALGTDVNSFRKNKYDIFSILIAAANEAVPKKTISSVSPFAETVIVPQGQKAMFRRPLGKARAKMFLTQVGLAGVYETFRLDSETFEVSAHAVGGAVTVDYERVLDNAESLVEVMDILTEGLADSIFLEVHKALRAALNDTKRPAANKHTGSNFDAKAMMKLISVVKSYGDQAVIFAPPEFIAAMGPDAIVPATSSLPGVYSPDDIDAIHKLGKINIFRGTPVVEIPQSFIDETNTKTWIDPQMAYIFPSGKQKVVKVVLEGDTQMTDFENRDASMEINAWRKVGVAIASHYNWCIYQNTGITQTYDSPYKNLM